MCNPQYIRIISGIKDIRSVFAKYRIPFKKPRMAKSYIIELVKKRYRVHA